MNNGMKSKSKYEINGKSMMKYVQSVRIIPKMYVSKMKSYMMYL